MRVSSLAVSTSKQYRQCSTEAMVWIGDCYCGLVWVRRMLGVRIDGVDGGKAVVMVTELV